MQFEVLVGMGEGVVRHQRCDMRKLGGFGFEELLARGGIEKEIANCDGGADGQPSFLDFEDFPAIDLDDCSRCLFGGASLEVEAGNRGDRGQSLPTKAEGGHAQQILGILEFRRGVPLESEQGVVAHHAASVVGDLDELLPTRFDLNLDASGASVERVFEEFLDDRSWTLHHLASGDLVGDCFGENVDAAHGSQGISRQFRR